jgi:hypothetical protein
MRILAAAFILSILFLSCKEKERPCPQMMPALPMTPFFTLTDKVTGVSVVDSLDIMRDSIVASQPCNTNKSDVVYDKVGNQFLFAFQNINFDGNSGCKTMYIHLYNADTDTVTIEGYRRTYNQNDPCGPNSEFIVEKVFYNGAEAARQQISQNGYTNDYYALKK